MNILLVVAGVVALLVILVIAIMVLRPDLLRLEQIAPIESPTTLTELRSRVAGYAARPFQELTEMPESSTETMEIEGVEIVFRAFRSPIEDGGVKVVAVAEAILGGTDRQPIVGSASSGFRKSRNEQVEPLETDDLERFGLPVDFDAGDPFAPPAEIDAVSPPGLPTGNQRPLRIVEWLRLGPIRGASPCDVAHIEWTAGMDDLEEKVILFANRVGRIEESRLSPELLNERIDVLGRQGAIYAQTDSRGDQPTVVIVGFVPIARWPLGQWIVLGAYTRYSDEMSRWLSQDELSGYW